MNTVIAGGTGLIGKALSKQLLDGGGGVTVLTRSGTPRVPISGVKYTPWGSGSHEWMRVIDGADAVVNLAGENIGAGRWTHEKKQRILQSRVSAGKLLVEAISRAERKPICFVQASAIGFYGTNLVDTFDETTPNGRDYLSGIAQIWEDSTREVEALGVIRAVIRTGIVLDRREGALSRMLLPFRLFAGGPIGSGRQWMSWIHLEDEVRAIEHILLRRLGGVFNLTAPNPVRNREMGMTIAETLSRPYWMPVPAFAMKIAFGEMSTLVLDGQKVIPRRLQETGFEFKHPVLSHALKQVLTG